MTIEVVVGSEVHVGVTALGVYDVHVCEDMGGGGGGGWG